MNSSFVSVPPRLSNILSRRRSRRSKLRVFSGLITAAFISLVLLIVVTAVVFGFFARNLPSPNKLSDHNFNQSTKIYDRNGILLYNVYGDQNRTLVTLDKIPMDLRNATIAAEDKRFYKNNGFDILAILRALKELLIDHKMTGASTLTQQLVKNALLTPERTITRKIKEFVLSIEIEHRYSKNQILQMYLNEIPYGGTAWGVEAAANQYFGKHVWQLNLVESAVLAGLPQSPTYYSPFGANSRAYIDRTTYVLGRMEEDGYITKQQEVKAVKALPKVKFASFGYGIKAPHFALYVKSLLEEKYGARLVQEGGLKVTTTLDSSLQDFVQKTIADEIRVNGHRYDESNGAAIIEDTKTGEILAMVGSKNYFAKDIQGNFNVATQGLRQPGSALKPFNYITGFENGYNPATMFLDVRTNFGNYTPGNYCDCFAGPLSVRTALGNSRNIPAVKMLAVNGVQNVINTLKDFGITTLNDPNQYGLSLTLGGGAIKLNELTNAYSILGNMGKKVSSVAILKVTTSDGKVLEEYHPDQNQKQVVAPEYAYLIDNILSDPTAKYMDYSPYYAHLLNFQKNLAVKTGTSEMKRDNWGFGFTPSYTVGVWVGNNDNSPMYVASGITGAAPILESLTHKVLDGKPIDNFKKPSGIVMKKVDTLTGQQPTKGSKTRMEYFTKWQTPPAPDMIKQVQVCKKSGLLANDSCIVAGQVVTKTYYSLYDPYTKMFMPNFKYCLGACAPTATDTKIYTQKSKNLEVSIDSPEDNAVVPQPFTVTAKAVGPYDIVAIQFYLDDELKKTINSPGTTSSYTFTSVPPGISTVKVIAFDSSGDSVEVSINVLHNP